MAGSRGLDLADDRRNQFLLQPFTVFIDLDDIDEQLQPEEIDEIRRENAEFIPSVLPTLGKLAPIHASEETDPARPSRKVGRNERCCPCSSGKRYKRCCNLS